MKEINEKGSDNNEELQCSSIEAMTRAEVRAGLLRFGMRPLKSLPEELKPVLNASQRLSRRRILVLDKDRGLPVRVSHGAYPRVWALRLALMLAICFGASVLLTYKLRGMIVTPEKLEQLRVENEKLKKELAAMKERRANDNVSLETEEYRKLQRVSFTWPIEGNHEVIFGGDGNDSGVEIPTESPAPVRAGASGTIVTARQDEGLVVIDHGNGITTTYKHLAKVSVPEGQPVDRGQVIGGVDPGTRSHAHLHYEIRINDHPVKPLPYLAQRDQLRSRN